MTNQYIIHIKEYIHTHSPLEFEFNEERYHEINNTITKKNKSYPHKDIVCAAYSLLYTSIDYHIKASSVCKNQPYYILIGDYINSYITEILYKYKLLDLLKVFSIQSKEIMLNYINNESNDQLLEEIIKVI